MRQVKAAVSLIWNIAGGKERIWQNLARLITHLRVCRHKIEPDQLFAGKIYGLESTKGVQHPLHTAIGDKDRRMSSLLGEELLVIEAGACNTPCQRQKTEWRQKIE